MHLLAARPGVVADGAQAVDLGQSPGQLVVLSAADSELACLAAAQRRRLATPGQSVPSVRLASLLHLGHNLSVDLHVETVIRHARLIVVRLLGGRGYWPYGVEQVCATARAHDIPLAWLPGDDQPDAELAGLSSLPAEAAHRLWQYCVQGGVDNAEQFLAYAASLIGYRADWREPAPLLRAGVYWPGRAQAGLDTLRAVWRPRAPVAAVVFYRALVQAANTGVIDALSSALLSEGLNPLPLFATSLRDPVAAATVRGLLARTRPKVILNTTGFAVGRPGEGRTETPFDAADCPVLQVVFSGGDEAGWRKGQHGLSGRDIAMNVALPEVDGRVLVGAVSFKGRARRDTETQTDIVDYRPVPDRVAFAARLAAAWVKLRRTAPGRRRVAIVLANYPNRDGRLGNGVGLDTPAATVAVLETLAAAGYDVADTPADGEALIRRLAAGPTNAATRGREIRETLSLSAYRRFFAALPDEVQRRVNERWGPPGADPFYLRGRGGRAGFAIPAMRCGKVAIGLQPGRGYHIDPVASYHDPALVPPHGYLAFYAWLRRRFRAHAVVHMGKHGNLEWLPG
ncbi:MAG: cobaltochelatase subunit CobN, partial [Kiloniellales bacterium]